MSALDYVLRLDDDSLILRPIGYDLFRYTRANGIKYGYVAKNYESACVDNLWPAVDRYIEQEDIRPHFYYNWSMFLIFYNNFELSSMELWRSQSYKKYIDYIDHLGGIYYNRWGDAPVKTLAITLFLPAAETHCFSDVAYKHQGVDTLGTSIDVTC